MVLSYRWMLMPGGWELLFEAKVRDEDEFHRLRMDVAYGRRSRMTDSEVTSFFVGDAHHALLYFRGFPHEGPDVEEWWIPHDFGKDESYLEYFPAPPPGNDMKI
jgi:hypothetical protein